MLIESGYLNIIYLNSVSLLFIAIYLAILLFKSNV